MASRRGQGSNGLDFTPVYSHYLFLVTFVLAFVRVFRCDTVFYLLKTHSWIL
jgi:hypothetical protein